jgi:teichuronic acid biosynthesis glycosyltransferase TuaH
VALIEPSPAPLGAVTHARDVVFCFSYVSWASARARGMAATEDRMVQTLLDHERVRRLLVGNPYRSLPLKLVRDLGGDPREGFPAEGRHELVQPLRLRRTDPAGLDALERTYARYEASLRRAARRMGLERPAVITANPLLAGFGRFDWAGPVTFYAIDDWTAYHPHRRWWPGYRAAFERLRERERRVCAISETVLERLAPSGRGIVVPNGLEPAEWERPAPPPGWFADSPGPRLLYVGSLDDRLDVEVLERLARELPAATIALVGPLLDRQHLAPLARFENVVVHAPVGRDELTRLVAGADACLLPHVRSSLTEGMSPLKLYEYLAAGRPVASVDLPPVRGVDPRVILAEPEAFTVAVQRALALGPAPESERRRFVAANSWARRHEAVIELALA